MILRLELAEFLKLKIDNIYTRYLLLKVNPLVYAFHTYFIAILRTCMERVYHKIFSFNINENKMNLYRKEEKKVSLTSAN